MIDAPAVCGTSSGPVRLTCTLTGEPVPDFYNRPGVAALFFDPLDE